MLPNPTLDKLQILRLHGMVKALSEQHAGNSEYREFNT